MRRLAFLFAGLFLAEPALAQDWATRQVCTVVTPEIHADLFDPYGLDRLEDDAAKIPNGTGRLWRITTPEGAVSHLWGTFHSADAHILRAAEAARDLIETARIVAVEIDFSLDSRAAYREAQYVPGRYNEATDPFAFDDNQRGTIANLPAEISGWILDRAIELGWTEDADLILSPAGMAEMLLSDPCEDFTGGTRPIQDDYIQLIAHLAGAETLGLEAPTAFFDDLKNRPETARAITAVYGAYLQPMTDSRPRSTGFAMYQSGQIGLMSAWDRVYLREVLGPEGDRLLDLTNDYLLTFRNERFLKAIRAELEAGGVFLAVGVGHLPGTGGLVEMLRTEGYTVTRLPLPGEVP